MTNDYELADDNRADLIYEKDRLLAPLQPGVEPPPHAMAPGSTEENYYRGGEITSDGRLTPLPTPTVREGAREPRP